jgi:hypothetical protein
MSFGIDRADDGSERACITLVLVVPPRHIMDVCWLVMPEAPKKKKKKAKGKGGKGGAGGGGEGEGVWLAVSLFVLAFCIDSSW